jgi:hypothetical protein
MCRMMADILVLQSQTIPEQQSQWFKSRYIVRSMERATIMMSEMKTYVSEWQLYTNCKSTLCQVCMYFTRGSSNRSDNWMRITEIDGQ